MTIWIQIAGIRHRDMADDVHCFYPARSGIVIRLYQGTDIGYGHAARHIMANNAPTIILKILG